MVFASHAPCLADIDLSWWLICRALFCSLSVFVVDVAVVVSLDFFSPFVCLEMRIFTLYRGTDTHTHTTQPTAKVNLCVLCMFAMTITTTSWTHLPPSRMKQKRKKCREREWERNADTTRKCDIILWKGIIRMKQALCLSQFFWVEITYCLAFVVL